MEAIGLHVIVDNVSGSNMTAEAELSGKWDWQVFRNGSELISVVQNTANLAPTGPQTSPNSTAPARTVPSTCSRGSSRWSTR